MLLFGISVSAKEIADQRVAVMQMATMSKADTQALFGKNALNVNAVALNKNEMAKTEGEWGWFRFVFRNINIDGYNGSRIIQFRWRKRPIFRIDYKANPSPTKLHLHFGNMKYHRPWYAPWKKF